MGLRCDLNGIKNWELRQHSYLYGFSGGSVVKNLPAKAREADSIPGVGRVSGGGNGNPLQYSCLGNPMDRGTWRPAVQGVAKSQTQPSNQVNKHTVLHTTVNKELPGVIKTWGWNSDVAELKASGAKAFRSRTSEEQFSWCCSGICFLRPAPEIFLQDLLPLFSSAQATPQDCTAAQNTSFGNQCPRLRSDLFGNYSFSSMIPYSSQIVLSKKERLWWQWIVWINIYPF